MPFAERRRKIMKSITKKTNKKKVGFTIVELLTVMSIIVILIGLLVPAINRVRMYAKEVTQRTQLAAIGTGIEFFSGELDGYPPSSALDSAGNAYCGALKLCEAMMGQDLMGFHPDSDFLRDGVDRAGRALYVTTTLDARKKPYLQLENANVQKLVDIYGAGNTSPFLPESYVLCDVFSHSYKSGARGGMPILYYKADVSNSLHDPNTNPTATNSQGNIYNYWDNQMLVMLGKPWEQGTTSRHALMDRDRFYKNTRNHKIPYPPRPYRADSFILITAGLDGEYGTADDICNFEWKYRE